MTFTYKIMDGWLKIYINGLVHIQFQLRHYLSMKSWYNTDAGYYIRLYMKGGNDIKLEYSTRYKWEQILKLLEMPIKTN